MTTYFLSGEARIGAFHPPDFHACLARHGFAPAPAGEASVFVLPDPADVAAAEAAVADFAKMSGARLAVLLLPDISPGQADWVLAAKDAALRSLIRSLALRHAPANLRVNAIAVGGSVPPADVAGTIAAMLEMSSMTGQTLRLAA
jgi:hypothetical protein